MTKEELINRYILPAVKNTWNDKIYNRVKQLLEPKQGETVSLEAFKQVLWEREIAEQQLHELGYELGEKIEPKQGEWLSHHHGCEYECSECHDKQRAKSKYCPNCGSVMRGDKE